MIGTNADDGGNVDCYVITTRRLETGQIVECEPIALMEQFEDGVDVSIGRFLGRDEALAPMASHLEPS